MIYGFFSTFADMKPASDNDFLHAWIAQGEHQQQDFKFEISDARKIARSLSAFANTNGGRLLVGVKDNGRLAGIRSEEEQYMIEAAAERYCQPQVEYSCQTLHVEGKNILVVNIPETANKPIYAIDEEGRAMAYVRVKDENILATPVHLLMWREQERPTGELTCYTEREQRLLQALTSADPHQEGLTLSRCSRASGIPRRLLVPLLARFIRYGLVEIGYAEQHFRFFSTHTP